MKMKKLLLSAFLSIVFMFSSFVPSINCYAVSISDINTYFDVQGKFYQILKRVTDISTTQEHQTSILNKMYDILENGGYNGSRSGQGLEQNGDITINTNGDVLLSVDLQNAIRQASQYEIDNNMGYIFGYSCGSASFLEYFNDQNQYHAFLNFINEHDNSIILFSPSSNLYIHIMQPESGSLEFVRRDTPLSYITTSPYNNWIAYGNITSYIYDSNSSAYVFSIDTLISSSEPPAFLKGVEYPLVNSPRNLVVDLNSQQYIIYNSFDSMRSGTEGLQEYYVGNDFSTSNVSTTQTLTDSMLNSSISYSDISNYVNSYYVTNQSYPTTNNVYNYINNYDGSGGSGGSGDNGSGGDGSNIWDFLGSIGDFLGHLIEGLGNVLSGILSLLTDVIDMFIGENGLPNVVGQLINYFMPFLPEWVPTLIGFSIVLALILGVIKLIRG